MKNTKGKKSLSLLKIMGRELLNEILTQPYRKQIVLHPNSEFLCDSLKAANCKYVWSISKFGLLRSASDEEILKAIRREYRADARKRGFVFITRNRKPFKKLTSKEIDIVVIPVARRDENFTHNLKSLLVLSVSFRDPVGIIFEIKRTRCQGSGGFQVDSMRIANVSRF